jgi:hypothetical protein
MRQTSSGINYRKPFASRQHRRTRSQSNLAQVLADSSIPLNEDLSEASRVARATVIRWKSEFEGTRAKGGVRRDACEGRRAKGGVRRDACRGNGRKGR